MMINCSDHQTLHFMRSIDVDVETQTLIPVHNLVITSRNVWWKCSRREVFQAGRNSTLKTGTVFCSDIKPKVFSTEVNFLLNLLVEFLSSSALRCCQFSLSFCSQRTPESESSATSFSSTFQFRVHCVHCVMKICGNLIFPNFIQNESMILLTSKSHYHELWTSPIIASFRFVEQQFVFKIKFHIRFLSELLKLLICSCFLLMLKTST